jgi:predicted nucleic acid-binding protein
MLVYIETTVWSFALADDSPNYTADTLEFFKACRAGKIDAVIGPVVIGEIARAPSPLREQLLSLINDISPRILIANQAANDLARAFLDLGAVPPSKPDDAAHVAAAFIEGVDVLVSWNFKHITNIHKAQKFNAIAALRGLTKPLIITTPSEVAYEPDQG